ETARARMRTREKNDRPDRCSWTGRIVTSGDSAVQERRASREARLLVPRTTLSAGVTLTTRKAAPPGPCRLAWGEGKAPARATSSRHGRFERLPPRRGLRVRRRRRPPRLHRPAALRAGRRRTGTRRPLPVAGARAAGGDPRLGRRPDATRTRPRRVVARGRHRIGGTNLPRRVLARGDRDAHAGPAIRTRRLRGRGRRRQVHRPRAGSGMT